MYIRKGTTVVLKKGKKVAERSKGDLIGEMTLLLGDLPGVSIKAETAVEAYVIQHSARKRPPSPRTFFHAPPPRTHRPPAVRLQ